jgi:hypothetical protein
MLHPDFTGPVGTHVEIKILASHFPSFLARRRTGRARDLVLHGTEGGSERQYSEKKAQIRLHEQYQVKGL